VLNVWAFPFSTPSHVKDRPKSPPKPRPRPPSRSEKNVTVELRGPWPGTMVHPMLSYLMVDSQTDQWPRFSAALRFLSPLTVMTSPGLLTLAVGKRDPGSRQGASAKGW
jgi:hypothetical protein